MQLLQLPLLLPELGDGVFLKGEVPSQRTDFVIQGLEVGWGDLPKLQRLVCTSCWSP
jgi:hypothetical protein